MTKRMRLPSESPDAAYSFGSLLEGEVARLEARLDQLKAQVRQAQQLASLGTFAAMIAHEFGNLLTPILGRAQFALQENDPELMRKALHQTINNVKILDRFSSRILEVSAAKGAQRESVKVREVVDASVDSLCRDPAKDSIRFVNNVPEDATVFVDPLHLQQVLFNLFINAHSVLRLTRSGRLTVNSEVRGNQLRLMVKDNGPGISPELIPHLFEPFTTSKSTTAEGRPRCGGLGLAISRDLVTENKGTISVESELGAGTTFIIDLPVESEAELDVTSSARKRS